MTKPGTTEEPALDASVPLCDTHHHLWERPQAPYLLPQMEADLASGHRVERTVFVEWRSHWLTEGPECLRPIGEIAFARRVQSEAARRPSGSDVCAGIVGFVDLCLGERAGPVLEAAVRAGDGRLRGLRYVASWDDDPEVLGGTAAKGPGLYRDDDFRAGFRLLREFGLSFDAWLFQTQLDDVIHLARSFPDQPIVMNHTAGVLGIGRYAGHRYELFDQWHRGVRELADCPNVFIKLGGLGMKRCGLPFYGESEKASSLVLAQAWRPWIESCLDAFGAERCMIGSNFPVDGATCSYRVLWNTFKHLLRGASEEERAAVFHDTAVRFYRLTA